MESSRCQRDQLQLLRQALRIADGADCIDGGQPDSERILKQHCDIIDSLVDAFAEIVAYSLISDLPCQCLASALLTLTGHRVGRRCCQNAVTKFAASCGIRGSSGDSKCATLDDLEGSADLRLQLIDLQDEQLSTCDECYIRLADSAASVAASATDSSVADISWKVQEHCFKELADSEVRCLCHQRAVELAARDGRTEAIKRHLRGVQSGAIRSHLCRRLIDQLVVVGKVAALKTLAEGIQDTGDRNQCCYIAATNAALNDRFEAAIVLLQSIAIGHKIKKKCCKRLMVIAEQRHQSGELLRLAKSTKLVFERLHCLRMMAERAVKLGHFALLPSIVSEVANQSFKSQIFVSLTAKSAPLAELRIATALKILPQIKDPGDRTRLCQMAAPGAAHLGNRKLLEELTRLLPTAPSSKNEEAEDSPRDKLLRLAAEAAAAAGQFETAVWAARAIDSASAADVCLAGAAKMAQKSRRLDEAVSLMRLIRDVDVRESAQVFAYKRCLPRHQAALLSDGTDHGGYLAEHTFNDSYLLEFVATNCVIGEQFYLQKILLKATQHQLHQLLCSSLSHGHSALAAAILPHIENVDGTGDSLCGAPLMLAAELGNCHLIARLLELGACSAAQDSQGRTALSRARLSGRSRAVKVLSGDENPKWLPTATAAISEAESSAPTQSDSAHETQLSEQLHSALTRSGFTQQRATCQHRLADMLEQTVTWLSHSRPSLIGSFADGWGSSLTQVNGTASDGSGIDWLIPVTAANGCLAARKLQLDFSTDVADEAPKLENDGGTAQLPTAEPELGFGLQPPVTSASCGVRLPVSTTFAFRSPQSRDRLLVPASSVRDANEMHFRETFALQERQQMRQLNTTQGQLFILLKFLFKIYLPEMSQCPGLTGVHAKHLLFHLLKRHGSWNWQKWQPQELIHLAKEALDLMRDFLDSAKDEADCMPSFFDPEVHLQLKLCGGAADEVKTRFRAELLRVRTDIDPAVKQLLQRLKPLEHDNLHFHLFTLLPLTLPPDVPHHPDFPVSDIKDLAATYCAVAAALRALQTDEVDGGEALMRQLRSWFRSSWCHCAIRCLTVMAHLKQRNKSEAREMLRDLARHQVMSRGWTVSTLSEAASSDDTQSWQWPLKIDWAWRFCLPCNVRPSLPFLPEFTQSLLTARLSSCHNLRCSPVQSHLYVNFRCLIWSLQAELLSGRYNGSPAVCLQADGAPGSRFVKQLVHQWFEEMHNAESGSEPDVEELATLAHYTGSSRHLRFCLERMEAIVSRERPVAMETIDEDRLVRVRRKLERLGRCSLG